FIFLLIMGITGPQWSFEWYRDGLRKTLGTYEERSSGPERASGGREREKRSGEEQDRESKDAQLLPLASYLAATHEIFPHKGDIRLSLPQKGDDVIKISKYKAGFFAPSAA